LPLAFLERRKLLECSDWNISLCRKFAGVSC
jgi:hypothetical protein